MEAYITALSSFLPNSPINNDEMETILGLVDNIPSRTRRIILRNNKILQRYYAINPDTLLPTHSNAQLTAEAIRGLRQNADFDLDHIECLCCGTSSPDQLMPGHASMVHGELSCGPCEVVSTAGICACGVTALKHACMQVALGETNNAVATGSELSSSFMHASMCGQVTPGRSQELQKQPALSFDSDFLRWMLSDGAGAAFISPTPATTGQSLKVEWIDQISSAHELDTCMYAGAIKTKTGKIKGWRNLPTLQDAIEQHAFLIKQDIKLLNEEIVTTAVDRTLLPIIKKRQLTPEEITWFLPHYSSDYFRKRLYTRMEEKGFHIPYERWFTNLETKGNTGAASIYIMLYELFHSGRLKKGDKILCFIPESGRFTICYMLLSVI
ncbi:MAG: beta-ketoacyl-ACP synthase III [Thermodesulfobacteriota bacterium]|nr:beta-ketoacyl-ACP synthase III [Thermodesulfobacteriota bacterium]